MKRLIALALFSAECSLAYLWQANHFEAAGRLLIFYYWALVPVISGVGALVLLGALLTEKRGKFPTEGVISRAFSWAMLVARVVGLVAVSHQWLAAVWLVANLLCRIGSAMYRDLPESA